MQEKVAGFRLSPQQQRTWLFQQKNPSAFSSQAVVRLSGALDESRLQQSVARLVGQHEILRTVFHRRVSLRAPFQVVLPDSANAWSWQDDDLSGSDIVEQQAQLAELLAGEREQAWDYEHGPLVRLRLLRLGGEESALGVTLPAMCADARTLELFVAELTATYTGEQARGEVMQYADVSEWQNNLLEASDGGDGAEHWRAGDWTTAASLKLPFELWSDEAGANVSVFDWQQQDIELGRELATTIEAAASERKVSVAAWLQTCWTILLWRLCGRPADLIIGVEYDVRKYEELEGAFGLLSRQVPVRVEFDAGLSFGEVLERVEEARDEAAKWQEYFSWETLGRSAAAASTTSGTLTVENRATAGTLFCAAQYEYEERQPDPAPLPELAFRLASARSVSEPFKLKLRVSAPQDTGGSLRAELHWDACVLSHASARCLVAQLRALLAHSLADPAAPIAALSLLTAQERQRLLVAGNDTARAYPTDIKSVHELFERQAARQPEATAVVCEDEQLTYGELNERANVLAHHLRALGVGAESRVALLMERSVAMVAALLAVLKAGGAYVPLDASYPQERLSFMLEDSGAEVLLTQPELADVLRRSAAAAGEAGVQIVDIEEVWAQGGMAGSAASSTVSSAAGGVMSSAAGGRAEKENVAGGISAANLAYVIYTSGSTGRPKGVMVEHRQLSNYLWAAVERLRLPAAASYAVVSTLAADLGHTMTFPALCLGGQLHVLTRERASDAEALGEYFQRHAIDCLKIVPSHLEAVCGERGEGLPRLRLVLGGEAARAGLVERLTQLAAPECEIYNHYGPTETTVGAVAQRIGHGGGNGSGGERAGLAGLGQPLGNVRAYVLDGEMRACAVGEAGELYVGGAGVARGYLDRPELTAERFVPDVMGVGGEGGGRLYRTGDVGRVQADGTIEFLGRIDNQIKFHGHRVELNEIRFALNRHLQVRDSSIVVTNDKNGNAVIMAYYVSRQEIEPGQLREFLMESVIEETLPNVFVHLKKLPLTLNGKINYQALPTLEEARRSMKRNIVMPRTQTEETLAGIWNQVLGLESVSIHDNFFELGGHSLLATRVVTRVREAFNVELPLRIIFEEPTIAGLALAVMGMEMEKESDEEIGQIIAELEMMSEEELGKVLNREGHAAEKVN
jgi:amino acid adenylation domain-containing protein